MDPCAEYARLTDQVLLQAACRRQPASGVFEITSRCNLACRVCYVRRDVEDTRVSSEEISAGQWTDLATAAVEEGMLFVQLTGGEPFVRSDFFEIYEPLRSMGVVITLSTNATLVTEEIARRLAAKPPNKVEISLYGATRRTYETVSGVAGSFERCVCGIERLLSSGIQVVVGSTLSKLNIHELGAMRAMARDWGVPFSFYPLLTKRRDGRPSAAVRLRLSARN